MEFGMYCISSNKKYLIFFLVDLFELQCAYAAVHSQMWADHHSTWDALQPESVLNIDAVSNICFLTFLSKMIM
jgi:hypothetical protein